MTKVEIIEQILILDPQFKSFKCKLWGTKKTKLEKILLKIKREKE